MIAEIRCVAAQYGHMVEQTTSNEREQVQFRLISMRHNAGHAPRARAGSSGTIACTTATRGRTARNIPYSTAYCDRTVRSESSSRLVSFDLFSDSAGRSSSSAATDSDEPKIEREPISDAPQRRNDRRDFRLEEAPCAADELSIK